MRHGAALERGGWPLDDGYRPLTTKGRARFARLVGWLAEHGRRPEVILTSPLVRAVQTAEILASPGPLEVVIEPTLAPGGSADAAARALRARSEAVVAAVGHEPGLSALYAALCGAALPARFPKGAVVALAVGRRRARFAFAALPRPRRRLDDLAAYARAAET